MMKGVGTSCCQLLKMWVKGYLNDMGSVWKNVELFVLLMGYGGRRYYLSSLGGWGVVG